MKVGISLLVLATAAAPALVAADDKQKITASRVGRRRQPDGDRSAEHGHQREHEHEQPEQLRLEHQRQYLLRDGLDWHRIDRQWLLWHEHDRHRFVRSLGHERVDGLHGVHGVHRFDRIHR